MSLLPTVDSCLLRSGATPGATAEAAGTPGPETCLQGWAQLVPISGGVPKVDPRYTTILLMRTPKRAPNFLQTPLCRALLRQLAARTVQLKICDAGNPTDVAKLVKQAKDAGEPVEGLASLLLAQECLQHELDS